MLREVNIVGENIETIREKDKPEYKKYPSQDSYSLYSESSKKIRQQCENKIPHKSHIIKRSC